MPISHEAAVLRGRIGGLTRAATTPDPRQITQQARHAQWQRFLDQIPAEVTDPAERQRRAELLRRAHMASLSLKAATARSRARRARQAAAEADAEAQAAEAVAQAEAAQQAGAA
jgi:hypothetical protein